MKKTLGIIGIGAFGGFILKHVTPYFKTTIYDAQRDVRHLGHIYNLTVGDLEAASRSDIVMIAVPVRVLEDVVKQIVPYLCPGQLVMDVASVKCLPTEILKRNLPDFVDIVSLHPLFGPQSGRYGIHGQNIAVIDVHGGSAKYIERFLRDNLDLNVITTTADEHDIQMAYVQGLTHMIARVIKRIDMPVIVQETKTFSLLRQMVDIVKDDSDELFYAIQRDNPYVEKSKQSFFDAVKSLEAQLQEAAQKYK